MSTMPVVACRRWGAVAPQAALLEQRRYEGPRGRLLYNIPTIKHVANAWERAKGTRFADSDVIASITLTGGCRNHPAPPVFASRKLGSGDTCGPGPK
jgi:hypothetical protein